MRPALFRGRSQATTARGNDQGARCQLSVTIGRSSCIAALSCDSSAVVRLPPRCPRWPAAARPDPAAQRSRAPAARDRSLRPPDRHEPRHLPRAARSGGARTGPACRDHLVPGGRSGPGAHRRPPAGARPVAARSDGGARPAAGADPAPAHPPQGLRRGAPDPRCRLAGDGRGGRARRAARRRRRDRPPPRRPEPDRRFGRGTDAPGPVRPQEGAGAHGADAGPRGLRRG